MRKIPGVYRIKETGEHVYCDGENFLVCGRWEPTLLKSLGDGTFTIDLNEIAELVWEDTKVSEAITKPTSMSDSQWEAAARRYCELLGLDPDADVDDPAYGIASLEWNACRPRWIFVVPRLKSHNAMSLAIEHGKSV